MALWEIHCGDTMLHVDAANWLDAIGRSLRTLGIPPHAMQRCVCELHGGGVAQVRDTGTGTILWARATTEQPPTEDPTVYPPLVVPVPMLLPVLAPTTETTFDDLTDPDRYVPPFDLVAELSTADERIELARSRQAACEAAVAALTDFIPAESAAVLLADAGSATLTFAVAKGPRSDDVRGLKIPITQGIAGYVATTGSSIIVLDAQTNPKHYDEVDRRTGYRTQDMLAAAIRTADGPVLGVLELLNPPKTFVPWNLEASCAVAETLARRLAQE
jgi:hypothetical protein